MNKTDEDIIKALECCIKEDYEKIRKALCAKCPYCKNTNCKSLLQQDVLNLINRYKADVEELKAVADAELDTIHDIGEDYERVLEEEPILIQKAKAEAIKEFAERLKSQFHISCDYTCNYVRAVINDLVKEMTENEGKE